MTYHKLKKKRNNRIKSIVSSILILLFAIISSVVLISEKRKLRPYDERVFYFVSAGSSRTISLLEDKKELLKNLGGANVVYTYKGQSHLIASVYLDQESADEIKSNFVEYFPEVGVLKIKSKRVSTKGIKVIKEISGAEEFIKNLYKISTDFQELQMKYLSGEFSESDFLSDMVEKKIKFEKLLSNVEANNELAEKIISFGEIMSLQMTSFLSGLTISKNKQNFVCNYFVGFYLNYVELFDCL